VNLSSPTWTLAPLIAAAGLPATDLPATPVLDIQSDSRRVRPGSLFVAYRGLEVDGHEHIPAAIAAGAVAVVAERPLEPAAAVPVVLTPNGRAAWAFLEAAWRRFPSRRLRLSGVTGTDGKTTTSTLLHHILTAEGHTVGIVSTLGARVGFQETDTGLHTSTPTPAQMQQLLADMVRSGCDSAVIEATSEGLAQHRLDGCDFDLAVVTNVTSDHLYYHGTREAYLRAKGKLFESLGQGRRSFGLPKVAVLNRDDCSYDHLRALPAERHLSYGSSTGADVVIGGVSEREGHLEAHLHTPWGRAHLRLALVGQYNAWNAAAAVAAACSWRVPLERAAGHCSGFSGVPGRMEFIRQGQPFTVIVDFAHTANALEHALRAVRPITKGQLIVVFGCAGERDVLKRAPMAVAAVTLADHAVFTAEDPRRESLADILAQMETAARGAGAEPGRHYTIEPDRAAAIRVALERARPGDTVILCGKGHEQSMCFGTEERTWDDRRAARQALLDRGFVGTASHP